MNRARAFCAVCQLGNRNSAGLKVRRWPLIAPVSIDGRHTTRCIGSIAICDDCIRRGANLNEKAGLVIPARRPLRAEV